MNPLEQFVANSPPPIDSVRDGAARCCEETAKFMRGERGPLRNPISHGLLAEFTDGEFGVAAEVAMIVGREIVRAGAKFRADQPWEFAAQLLRGGWQRGHKLVGHVIGKGKAS